MFFASLLVIVGALTIIVSSWALVSRLWGGTIALLIVPGALAALTWVATEGLSFFGLVSQWWIIGFWFVVLIALIVSVRRTSALQSLRAQGSRVRRQLASVTHFERFLGIGLALVYGITLIVGLISPPNNWDSLAYHLPRIMHWIQAGNVDYFPTEITRQLMQPPLAEYLALQSLITSHSDFGLNLIQWGSAVWCMALVGLIASLLKFSRSIVIVSMFFAGVIPIGVAESTTTQNEWLMTLWVLQMCALWLLVLRGYSRWPIVVSIAGLLMLCAAGTKQFSLIFAAGFLAALLILLLKRREWWVLIFVGGAGALGALIGLAPQLVRNFLAFGSVVGDPELAGDVSDQILAIGTGRNPAVNLLTHSLFNIPLPSWFPIEGIGDLFLGFAGSDTRSFLAKWGMERYLPFPGLQLHEDSAANPIPLFLGIVALVWFVLSQKQWERKYFGITVLGLFGFQLILVWAYIGTNRYMLPAMALTSIAIASLLSRLGTRFLVPIAVVALAWALFMSLFLEYRPVLPHLALLTQSREHVTFTARPEHEKPYLELAERVRELQAAGKTPVIGLCADSDSWEYPAWTLTGAPWAAVIVNSSISNGTKDIPLAEQLRPDLVFDMRQAALGESGVHDGGYTCPAIVSVAMS